MDDRIANTQMHCCNDDSVAVLSCDSRDSSLKDRCTGNEPVEENPCSLSEDKATNGDQEISLVQGPILPILCKILNLSTCIQALKEEHAHLSNQVKEIKNSSFPDPEMSNALHLLNTEFELLKKKYSEESLERKHLYNEVIELKGNIRVFCRCRPLNQAEKDNGSTSVVEFDSSQDNELQIISSDSSKKHFKFDHVFKPEDGQEVVFAQTKPIVTSVLDGYNVCIFAYGQTGTGKTYTMEGTPENRGVNYRTLEELFRNCERRSGIMKFELFVSMLEVYNEKIRDLLVENSSQPLKKLEVKQSAEGTQEVPGLVESRVYTTDEVWELLKTGYRVRSVGSTTANELSSRSHCLLRVTVKGENLVNGQKTRSHLWLVDLAGSERVGKIEVEGERLKESQFINKSLSALGDVISALASKTNHIPYRNSKLTHMLQNSLGGDCKTLMFVQISPSSADLGETLCSLNFASRVRGIEGGPARKQGDLTEVFKYKQMVEKLKHDEKETKKLQDSMQALQLRLSAREHICRGLQEKVRELESQLAEERKTRIKRENRALAAASSGQSIRQAAEKPVREKKPPLAPTKVRMPLRRISNFMPQPSQVPSKKTAPTKFAMASSQNKENNPKPVMAAADTKTLLKPRRVSIVVRPLPPPSTTASTMGGDLTRSLQPRRRVSIATLRPEPSISSYMTTPLRTTASNSNNASAIGRQSLLRDLRKARYSKLFSPMPEFKTSSDQSTPTAMRSGSKFMGSPPSQAAVGLWKPSHPTVIALQRKSFIWSPLKLKAMKSRRPSLIPLPPSTDMN